MTWLDLLCLLFQKLGDSMSGLAPYVPLLLLGVVWVAWWLWAVNWKKLWMALAKGAWMPILLLAVIASLAWTQLQPSDCTCLGFTTMPNGCWQSMIVAAVLLSALFCGWLQDYFHWTPHDIRLEPAPHGHGHHGHH
jgi:hypothetical protein